MQRLADELVRRHFGADPAHWPYTPAIYLLVMLLGAFAVINFAAITAGIFSWAERRVAARMQSRIGPNRAGPGGFLQWIADAMKLLFKEDIIPGDSDHRLFRIAPYFVMVGFACTFVALPFSHLLIIANLDIGLFYILAITSLVVVGILISGWSSNSKWSLFGAIRSAAQIVSYEIPAGLALMVPVMIAGSLSTQKLIRVQGGIEGHFLTQGGWPWNWTIFHDPAAFAAFFIYFISALAEGNRTPFDLPEAESELVAGYNTEYSGMRFSYFFLAEWGNMWVIAAIATTVFLGGWQIPGVPASLLDAAAGWTSFGLEVLSLAIFVLKSLALVFVIMWLRWTLPRIRVDQMMAICWKYLVPFGMASVLFVAAWLLILAHAPGIQEALQVLFFAGAGLIPLALFLRQTFRNIRIAGDRVDLSGW